MGRFLTIALIAMGVGGLSLVGWVSLRDTAPPVAAVTAAAAPAKPEPQTTVLVTTAKLGVGRLIRPVDLAEQRMATASVPAGASEASAAGRSFLMGAMVRRSLDAGEVVLPGDVMRPGDQGFLAAVLQPGMRAMTLGADALASTLDLVWPGDHVDVILTQQYDGAVPAGRRVFSNTVLSDVRVLAADQQPTQGTAAEQGSPKGPRSITVEVTPEQATRLTVAIRLGKLALSVRGADRNPAAVERASGVSTTWAGDVAPGLDHDAAPPRSSTVHVWHGSGDSKDFPF